MQLPDDIALRNSYNFCTLHLPKLPARVLEVGAGEGALAERLQQRGYHMLALDADLSAVLAARARGVEAVQATWPDYDSQRFDGLLFTRSLHQIKLLDRAVLRARQLLNFGGVLLVEDSAPQEFKPEYLISWCRQAGDWLKHAAASTEGGIVKEFRLDSTIARLIAARDPVEVWQEQHNRPRHSSTEMDAALRQRFNNVRVEGAPYLFRYLAAALPANVRYTELVQHAYDQEMQAMGNGTLAPLGRRWICH